MRGEYADYRDTMARIEQLVERVALEVLGTTAVTFRGHDLDLRGPWHRIRFVDALKQHELWTRDADELRAWLTERGVDTDADKDWAQLVDHASPTTSSPGSSSRRSSTTTRSSSRRSLDPPTGTRP